jgi:hypothetical protein
LLFRFFPIFFASLIMQFQHLIEINDPLNPLIDPLTREQLWRGLVLRAEAPRLFVPWLDECSLLGRNGDVLSRALRYNALVIHDHVTFMPQQAVRYDVPAQADIPESSLLMTIEEPQPEALFVRFEYNDGRADDDMDAFYNEFRRSAYQEADIDTIRVIRQLAAEGRMALPG